MPSLLTVNDHTLARAPSRQVRPSFREIRTTLPSHPAITGPRAPKEWEISGLRGALEAEKKLATERDILRPAANYFAGETNW